MKIFVTGAAGFLGSWLVEELLSDGHYVVGIDNMIGGYSDNIIKHDNYKFFKADILNLEVMTELMAGCDAVYHTAALAYEGLSVFSPTLVTNNIVTGSTAIATAAIRNNVKRLINCSSMARYGENNVPFTETMIARPHDPYGVAKYAAELQLNMLAETHGFEVVHAVPHNIIGPRQKYDDPFRNVASIMINLMLQNRQPIVYGDGTQLRCFSFVHDDLFVFKKLLTCELHEQGEKFNVGPDEEPVTINELAARIAKLLNFDLNIEYHDARPREVKLATCSADKIRQRFNYETKVTLDDGLQTIIDYIKVRGIRKFEYHLPIEIETAALPRTWKERLF
jgi:UDP-glucose 4-epimerase